jgi:sodium-dependent dicarboxylate transporter 2/3/5
VTDASPAAEGRWARRVRTFGLLLGPLACGAALLSAPPAGMSSEAWRVAAVAVWMAVWWLTEAIPIPATSLLPLVLFPLLGVRSIDATAAPYANPVVFLFLGGFVLAAAMTKSGLHRRLALAVIRVGGTRPAALVGSFMVATAFLSMWVSNTATVAMMLPLAVSVLALADAVQPEKRDGNFAVAMMLGLAYGANIGGLGTLIGTPPNALLAGFLKETHGVSIGFFEWMLFGVPLVVLALPAAWLLLTRVLYPVGRAPIAGGDQMIEREWQALGPMSPIERRVAIVTVLTAVSWIGRPVLAGHVPGLSDPGIAVTAALLVFVLPASGATGPRLLEWRQAEELPWGVLLLFGGGLSLASAIEATQLAEWIGSALEGLATLPLFAVVLVVTTLIVFLTELTSNTATAAALLPVVGALAVAIGADPFVLALPTALGASCAFMMPVGTPPNAIVYGSGRLTIPQMARAGLLLNFVMIALITALTFAVMALR